MRALNRGRSSLACWANCALVGASFGVAAFACQSPDSRSRRSEMCDLSGETSVTSEGATCVDAGAERADGGGTRTRTSIVDSTAWVVLSRPDDPFPDRPDPLADPPRSVVCDARSTTPEFLADEPVFSVDTGGCNYVTARQSILSDVEAGDKLVVRVWHFALTASASAVAHVAVRLGDRVLLDTMVPIASDAGLIRVEHVAEESFPLGSNVYFHLHNHGQNSWSLVEISTGPDL